MSRGIFKRREAFVRRGTFVRKHFSSFSPRALASCRCRLRPWKKASECWPVGIEPCVIRPGAVSTPGQVGGGSRLRVGCWNAELAVCGALTVVDANALAGDSVVQTLLPPDAEGRARPEGCAEGAAPVRAWNEKGTCMKVKGAVAGSRKSGSPARLQKPAEKRMMEIKFCRGRSSKALGMQEACEAP